MRLKLRFTKTNETKVVTLEGPGGDDSSILVMQLLDIVGDNSIIKAGFPPKIVDISDGDMTLKELGISNGEQLVVEPGTSTSAIGNSERPQAVSARPQFTTPPNDLYVPPPVTSQNLTETNRLQVKCGEYGYLRLRVMEDDNSCLFRSVGYTVLKNLDAMFSLRNTVRETILNDPEQYSDVILGKKREVYMSWICQENSWGGAIELQILANHFDITICSLDVNSLRVDQFNPGKDNFVIVVYSGIHYDAVCLSTTEYDTGKPEDDQTIFEGDMKGFEVLEALNELGKKLKNRHYYTDTNKFTLKCNICGQSLVGEKEATKHAVKTGHTDFGEY